MDFVDFNIIKSKRKLNKIIKKASFLNYYSVEETHYQYTFKDTRFQIDFPDMIENINFQNCYFLNMHFKNKHFINCNFYITHNISFYNCVFVNCNFDIDNLCNFEKCIFINSSLFFETERCKHEIEQCDFENSKIILGMRFNGVLLVNRSHFRAGFKDSLKRVRTEGIYNRFIDNRNNISDGEYHFSLCFEKIEDIGYGFSYSSLPSDFINHTDLISIPEKGNEIYGYKICRAYTDKDNNFVRCLVKLYIPHFAERVGVFGGKCRASMAIVREIIPLEGDVFNFNKVVSDYDPTFSYEIGKIIIPDKFDSETFHVCTNGIHFFMSPQEAKEYLKNW